MADSSVRLNPIKLFHQIKQDKNWQSADVKDLFPRAAWLFPVIPFEEDPDEDVTIGLVSRKIQERQNHAKNLWKDNQLDELEKLAHRRYKENLQPMDLVFGNPPSPETSVSNRSSNDDVLI